MLLVGTSPSLELFGTIDTTGTSNTSIQGNGSTTQNSSIIVIKEGARVLSDKAGIYHPQPLSLIHISFDLFLTVKESSISTLVFHR